MVDHYASLGVARTSEGVVIRAAYLALMRRYHPDTNSSPDAAERAREVATAYQVLGDTAKRADYDRARSFDFVEGPAAGRPKRIPVGPIGFAATMLLLGLVVMAVWMKPLGGLSPPRRPVVTDARAPGAMPALLAKSGRGEANSARKAVRRPALPKTADRLTQIAANDRFEVNQGARSREQSVSASLAARTERPLPAKASSQSPVAAAPVPRLAVVSIAGEPAKKVRSDAGTGCGTSGLRWTQMLCENKSLGALDQQLAAFDSQSWVHASAEKRDLLARSRKQFSTSRNECTTDACLRQLYLGRMKTVAVIMSQARMTGAN